MLMSRLLALDLDFSICETIVYQRTPAIGLVQDSANMEDHSRSGVLQELQESDVPFTNFTIEEILKPDFGRRSLTAGVLNLTVKRSPAHENRRPQGAENSGHHGYCAVKSDKTSCTSASGSDGEGGSPQSSPGSSPTGAQLWPAWVYCTRYSDRPSSGPRSRKVRRKEKTTAGVPTDDKRPRTAFSTDQLRLLKQEFEKSKYLTENRRQKLATDLNLNESQIKIWFQNKRAKLKKSSGERNTLAMELMAQGLYNHKTNEGHFKMET